MNPRRIAVIGTGRMGTALARQFVVAGHEVRVGSRDPDRGREKALEVGAAFGGINPIAAANAEVLVLAVPWGAVFETLDALGDLAGVVVVDVTNPGLAPGEREPRGSVSGGEQIQAFVPHAHVVKAWNHLYSAVIRRSPDFGGVPATVFVAGDDAPAKELVSALVRDLGYLPADAGPIASCRYLEPLAELMTTLDRLSGGRYQHALRLLRRERPQRVAKAGSETSAPTRAR